MDRRPREPRQLAGEYGSSEHGEECLDAAELSGERFFDADADAIRSGEALDDPVNADRSAADVTFKPKCLGIEISIQIHPTNAERCAEIQAEHVLAAQTLGARWFADNEQRQLARCFADKRFNLAHEFGWHANGYGSFVVKAWPTRPTPLHGMNC